MIPVLEAFNKQTIKTESHTTSHRMRQNFQKHYSRIFSVHKVQGISKLIAWNSHRALKAM